MKIAIDVAIIKGSGKIVEAAPETVKIVAEGAHKMKEVTDVSKAVKEVASAKAKKEQKADQNPAPRPESEN